MKKIHDIELLSLYLDGRLSPADFARLESQLASDPELASAFNDLRAARGILRKMPSRKAPRNFTLTRQMVGLKPPLPRSYSFFRFSTAFATVLLTLTFAANALTQAPFGIVPRVADGMGGGASVESFAAPEAPAAAPALAMEPLPTLTADSAATELPNAKQAATPSELMGQPPAENQAEAVPAEQPRPQNQALIPVVWQIALFALILFTGLIAFVLRRSASQKWK